MQRRVMLKHYWMIAVMGIAVAIGLNNILLMTDIVQYSKAYQEAVEILYAPSFGKQILYTGILAPIIEELLFRGLAFKIMRRWMTFLWSMIFSAILFAAYHGNLVQFIYAGLCGLLLAYIYEKFQSIAAPILAHMVMNMTACTMTEFGWFSWMFEEIWRVMVITIICIGIAGAVFAGLQNLDVTKMLKKYCKP